MNKEKWKGKWIIQTIIFDIVIIILFFLIRWNVLAGFLILLLLICTMFVGWILQAYTIRQKNTQNFSESPLSEK